MPTKKCIHVMVLLDWQKSIGEITIPLFKRYASNIGADLNLITERRFPDWPAPYEKHQIFEDGKRYDWNLHFNVDTLVHPNLGDITETHPPSNVGNWWFRDLRIFVNTSDIPPFERDGRFYGVDDALLVTSQATHNLWEPIGTTFETIKSRFKEPDPSLVTLFSLSYNFAKYGYRSSGVLGGGNEELVANLPLLPNHSRPLREHALSHMKRMGITVEETWQGEKPPSPAVSLALVNVADGETLARHFQKFPGVITDLLNGSDQKTLDSVAKLKDEDVLLLSVPYETPCNNPHTEFICTVLDRTKHLKRGRALLTSLQPNRDRKSNVLAYQWGMKMTELAAQHDVALIDLDILQSYYGDFYFFEEDGDLKDSGASQIAKYILEIVNHRNFSL